MRPVLLLLALAALAANVAPSVLYLMGRMDLTTCKTSMLWATVGWYIVGGALIYGPKPTKIEEPVVP